RDFSKSISFPLPALPQCTLLLASFAPRPTTNFCRSSASAKRPTLATLSALPAGRKSHPLKDRHPEWSLANARCYQRVSRPEGPLRCDYKTQTSTSAKKLPD